MEILEGVGRLKTGSVIWLVMNVLAHVWFLRPSVQGPLNGLLLGDQAIARVARRRAWRAGLPGAS